MIAKKKEFDMEKFAELVVGEFGAINETLTAMNGRFAAIDETLAEIKIDITTLKFDVANLKLDVHQIKEEQRSLICDVASFRKEVDTVQTQLDNQAGYSKEIDYAFTRISRIETHLSLPPLEPVCAEE